MHWPALHARGKFTFTFLPQLLIYPHFPFHHSQNRLCKWHKLSKSCFPFARVLPISVNYFWAPLPSSVRQEPLCLLPALWGVKLLRWSPTKAEEKRKCTFIWIPLVTWLRYPYPPTPAPSNVDFTLKWMATMSTYWWFYWQYQGFARLLLISHQGGASIVLICVLSE